MIIRRSVCRIDLMSYELNSAFLLSDPVLLSNHWEKVKTNKQKSHKPGPPPRHTYVSLEFAVRQQSTHPHLFHGKKSMFLICLSKVSRHKLGRHCFPGALFSIFDGWLESRRHFGPSAALRFGMARLHKSSVYRQGRAGPSFPPHVRGQRKLSEWYNSIFYILKNTDML